MIEQATMAVAAPPLRRRARRNYAAWALGVYAVLFLVFLLLPIVAVVWVSFSSATFIVFPLPG